MSEFNSTSYDVQESQDILKESVKNISFYNAYKLKEHSSRENEILDEQQNLKNMEQADKIENINSDLSNENLDKKYSEMSKNDQIEYYKDLYTMQQHYYIYNIQNDSKEDSFITENQLKNLKELDYLEKNVLSDSERYNSQQEVNQNFLNNDTIQDRLNKTQEQYQQQSQLLFQNTNEDDAEELQDKTKLILADKKVLDNNNKYITENQSDLLSINENEDERLERKRKEAKEVEKLQSKDIMWKIVEEQGKNSQYLKDDGEQTIDARTNADEISRQITTNDSAQYSGSQNNRNQSYTNAYSSLQHSQRVSNANVTQEKEDEYNKEQQDTKDDKLQNDNKQQRNKGISL